MMPFLGLLGCGGPSGAGLEFGRCGDRFSRQSPVQARFAGLVVGHDNENILLGGLDSTFGGYCPADVLLASPGRAWRVRGHSVLARGCGRLSLRITTAPDYVVCG